MKSRGLSEVEKLLQQLCTVQGKSSGEQNGDGKNPQVAKLNISPGHDGGEKVAT